MSLQRIKTIKTQYGKLQVYRNWDCEGSIVMRKPKTISRYKELCNEHPDSDKYGIFWAFSQEQFQEGYRNLITNGHIKEGDNVFSFGAGGYAASMEKLDEFFDFYKDRAKRIAKECDPQEVYFYEYNNHECMFTNDEEAFNVVVNTFGEDVANGIVRVN